MSNKVIGIIPVRGNSKRVENKSIIEINGKPLIYYTINAAKSSSLFTKVLVNSEDEKILAISEHFNADIYRRPTELSEDRILLIDVIKEMIISLDFDDDIVIGIMLATCPLRSTDDIRNAWLIFDDNERKSPVVSITSYERPIYLAQKITEDNCLTPVFEKEYLRTTRSQEHSKAYWYNGAIIFNTVGLLKDQNNLIGSRPIPYIMPFERSIDIDHKFQVDFVRLSLRE